MKIELEIEVVDMFDYRVRYKGRVIEVWFDGCADPSILIDGEYQDDIVHLIHAIKKIDEESK